MSLTALKLLFRPSYLFMPYPGYAMKFLVPLLIFFIILIILSVGASFLSKKNKKLPAAKLYARITNWLSWGGAVGAILLFFRYEGTPFVSMRFLLLLWLFVILVWGIYIALFYCRQYPKLVKDFKTKQEKERFLKKRA